MALEIEAKIQVDKLDPIAQKLKKLNARFVAELVQNDVYFQDTFKRLPKGRYGLRLRTEATTAGTTTLLTFKGPTKKSQFKSRPEFETRIDDVKAMQQILEGLGYRSYLTVTKMRGIWELDNCEVCLDNLPILGYFIEVEGPDEPAIQNVLTKLGLADQPHIREGYAAMTAKVESDNELHRILNQNTTHNHKKKK